MVQPGKATLPVLNAIPERRIQPYSVLEAIASQVLTESCGRISPETVNPKP